MCRQTVQFFFFFMFFFCKHPHNHCRWVWRYTCIVLRRMGTQTPCNTGSIPQRLPMALHSSGCESEPRRVCALTRYCSTPECLAHTNKPCATWPRLGSSELEPEWAHPCNLPPPLCVGCAQEGCAVLCWGGLLPAVPAVCLCALGHCCCWLHPAVPFPPATELGGCTCGMPSAKVL